MNFSACSSYHMDNFRLRRCMDVQRLQDLHAEACCVSSQRCTCCCLPAVLHAIIRCLRTSAYLASMYTIDIYTHASATQQAPPSRAAALLPVGCFALGW